MRRRISLATRAARAIVGLLTIWCLGCSAYEPLLDGLFGGDEARGMRCGAESMRSPADGASTVTDAMRTGPESTVVSAPVPHGYDCGCGNSCYAPSPTNASGSVVHPSVVAVPSSAPSEPSSVSRAPLLPPPEFAA